MPQQAYIQHIQSLQPSEEIILFELSNYNRLSPDESYAFSNFDGVIFGGRQYVPLACELSGVERKSDGSANRPKLKVSDVEGLISGLQYVGGDELSYASTVLEGAILAISKTAKDFLDGQALEDANAYVFEDSFLISQRSPELPGEYIEFELSSPFDFVDETLPARPVSPKCPYSYRREDCGYTAPAMFDINNNPTLDRKKDVCSRSIRGCKIRFGEIIPTGAFPGVRRF